MATKTAKKSTKKAAKKVTARKWHSLDEKDIVNSRRELHKLEKKGEGRGYIAAFAKRNGVSNVTAMLALRGRTYRYLPMPGVKGGLDERRGASKKFA